MGATSCKGRKSREDELGEYKPGNNKKNSYLISLAKYTF